MGYIYLVADASSDYFKFGISARDDESRILSYRTSMCKYIKIVVPSDNPRAVEAAVKLALRDCIQLHDSGRRSEICTKGVANCNMLRAMSVMLAAGLAPPDPALEYMQDQDMADAFSLDEAENEAEDPTADADPTANEDPTADADRTEDLAEDMNVEVDDPHLREEVNDPDSAEYVDDPESGEDADDTPIRIITSLPEHVVDTFLQHYPADLRWSRDARAWIAAKGQADQGDGEGDDEDDPGVGDPGVGDEADDEDDGDPGVGDALPADEGDARFKDLLKRFAVRVLDGYSHKLPSLQKASIKRTVNDICHPDRVEKYIACLRNVLRVPGQESDSDDAEHAADAADGADGDPQEGTGACFALDWLRKGGPGDFISCEDLYRQAQERGITVSKTKFGKFVGTHFGIRSFPKQINKEMFRGFRLCLSDLDV
eukprot:jgi/Tetstr1/447365/TSEL_034802.t1